MKKETKTNNIDKVIPLAGYVIVRRDDKDEESTESGILIANGQRRHLPEGTIISVSGQRIIGNHVYPSQVREGDKIYFEMKGPNRIIVDSQDYFMVKEEDILGRIPNENIDISGVKSC